MTTSRRSRLRDTATRNWWTSALPSPLPSSPTSSTASTTPTSTSPRPRKRLHNQRTKERITTMNTLVNATLNPFVGIARRSDLLASDLDYHVIRASMVIIFLFFGYQKWFEYEAERLIPFISNGPLISWMYPVFGYRGASWFLGVSEWTFGALLFAGFWDNRLGILGAAGSAVPFILTVTIIPLILHGWNA